MGEYIKKHFNAKNGVGLVLGAEMSDMKSIVNFKVAPHLPDDGEDRFKDDDLPLQKTLACPEVNYGYSPIKTLDDRDDYFCNTATFKKCESPSANFFSSAHDLAKVGQKLVNGEILSLNTIEQFHSEPITAVDHDDGDETTFTKGGVATFDEDFVGEGEVKRFNFNFND